MKKKPPPPPPQEEEEEDEEDPALAKFYKMLKMHIPAEAVKIKMRAEGVDPSRPGPKSRFSDRLVLEVVIILVETKNFYSILMDFFYFRIFGFSDFRIFQKN